MSLPAVGTRKNPSPQHVSDVSAFCLQSGICQHGIRVNGEWSQKTYYATEILQMIVDGKLRANLDDLEHFRVYMTPSPFTGSHRNDAALELLAKRRKEQRCPRILSKGARQGYECGAKTNDGAVVCKKHGGVAPPPLQQ
jgi:hypothetical protein